MTRVIFAMLLGALLGAATAHAEVPTAADDTPLDALTDAQRATFHQAEAAWQDGLLYRAEELFEGLTREAPDFDRAWRRRCGVVLEQDRAEDARTLCREALSLRDSAPNRTGLALALIRLDPRTEDAQEGRPELTEARALIDVVTASAPDYVSGWHALCAWGAAAESIDALDTCLLRLADLEPASAGAWYYEAVRALLLDDHAAAMRALRESRRLGLSPDLFRPLAFALAEAGVRPGRQGKRRAKAKGWTWQDAIPWGVGAVLVVSVLLVAFGRRDEPEPGADRE